jgi:hypothetical protein
VSVCTVAAGRLYCVRLYYWARPTVYRAPLCTVVRPLCAERHQTLIECRAPLYADLQWAQGVRGSSLCAGLDCVAALRTLILCW